MLFMNVYEVYVVTMNCNIDYSIYLAKFWGSSSIAVMHLFIMAYSHVKQEEEN